MVFAVLADPRAYADFVVGTKRIRRFDPTWPGAGSELHHSLGIGPFVLRDLTRVEEIDDERRLVLRAQMGPPAVNRVAFALRPTQEGTEVEIEEYPLERPAAAAWNPVLDGVMWLRNAVLLRRLKRLAERRLARREAGDRAASASTAS